MNDRVGLANLDEEVLEANNKVLRSVSTNLARKTNQLANLRDVLNRMWISSGPGICLARNKVQSECRSCGNLGHKTIHCSDKIRVLALEQEEAILQSFFVL